MADRKSIEQLLDALQAGDRQAAAAIWAHFQECAHAVAKQQISPHLQAQVGASDVVQEAMKSALSLVGHGGLHHNNSAEFEAILFTIIRRKVANAARKAALEKPLPAETSANLPDKGPQPDEMAMQKESDTVAAAAVWEITDFLFQQREAMQSKHQAVRGLVRVLGVVHGLEAPEIREMLQELFPGGEPPAKRTIQLAIEQGWELVRNEFGNDSGPED